MNSLYTLALRQSSSLSSDIQHLASLAQSDQLPASSAPIHHQIAAGLEQLDRTVRDYDAMAQREIVTQIRDKALARVDRFKREYAHLDQEYKRLKTSAADRSELLASSSSSSSISHHPATAASSSSSSVQRSSASAQLLASGAGSPATPQPRYTPNSPWVPSPSAYPTTAASSAFAQPPPPQQTYGGYGYDSRTDAALREHDFLGQTGQAIDAYLAQGQAVLGNLANQRDVLKGTRRRLLSAANTLGLSRSTITFIERRTRQDYYFLILGGLTTLVCFWLILKYLG